LPARPEPVVPEVQAAKLAQIKPWTVRRDAKGAVSYIYAPEIEHVDLSGVLRVAKSGEGELEIDRKLLHDRLAAALSRMQALTLRETPVEFEIRAATVVPGELAVGANELVHGIPVDQGGLVVMHPDTGRIREFAWSLEPDGADPGDSRAWLTKQQAVGLAQTAIVSDHGGPLPAMRTARIHLVHRIGAELRPEWEVTFSNSDYGAKVDATSGETQTYSMLIY
jgi:hypothetical protein